MWIYGLPEASLPPKAPDLGDLVGDAPASLALVAGDIGLLSGDF